MNANALLDELMTTLGAILPSRVTEKLVFVIGSGRCGTTLFMRILKTNPTLRVVPGEMNRLFHGELYPQSPDLHPTVPSILSDVKTFTEASLAKWPTNRERIARRLRSETVLAGGKAIVVKSAMISFMVEALAERFPGAHFIHVYRHGIPVVNSIVVKEWEKHAPFFSDRGVFAVAAARYWTACVTEIMRCSADGGMPIHHVSYEALIKAPRQVVGQIAEKLGWEPEFNFPFDEVEDRNQDLRLRGEFPHATVMRELEPGLAILGYH